MLRRKTSVRAAAAVGPVAAALAGGLATDPDSEWFRGLDKPGWSPPPQAFGIVWTALYASLAWAAGEVLARAATRRFARAYELNLLLNAAWTPLFFRLRRPWWAAAEAAALTVSSLDLVRRARPTSPRAAVALVPYAAWCGFATLLSTAIARRNRRSAPRFSRWPGV